MFLESYNRAIGLYVSLFKVLFFVVSMLPLVVTWVLLFYLVAAVTYMLLHPELLVKAMFSVFDLVPWYTQYATAAIANQLKDELKDRFR